MKWKLIDATKTIDQDSQRVHIMIRAQPFFTIGHSTRPIAVFVDLLRNAKIRLIIDVRTVPRSRTNPQYNGDALPESLSSSKSHTNTSPRSEVCVGGGRACRRL